MPDLDYTFYGCRGSYPVSNSKFNEYGGHTASFLVERGEKAVIFDAGTGIINIGNYLKEKKINNKKIDIFLTHLHSDHIQGLPFFYPVFEKEYQINVYCPRYRDISAESTIYTLFNHPFSPISNEGIKAEMKFTELAPEEGKIIPLEGDMRVEYVKEDSHPVSGVLIYKLSAGNASIVYATDVESPGGFEEKTVEFIRGANILIHDSQYFDHQYFSRNHPKRGFGHSTSSMAVENAKRCEVERLYLFHYDPSYSDGDLEKMLEEARKGFKTTHLARELKINKLRS